MNSVQRILIIDDETAIRTVLRMSLLQEGYQCAEAANGELGLQMAASFHPNLILLDLGMPDMGGEQVLKKLRSWTTIPILVLTVDDEESTKVRLLDSGADDYLTKPFGPSELLARVRVALRHNGQNEATPIFESGDLKVDLNQKMVWAGGQLVKLTNTEFEVLSRLVRDQGKVVSQMVLLKQVWGVNAADQSHYLRIYINQLRKKIEVNPSEPRHILTEPGIGYRLV